MLLILVLLVPSTVLATQSQPPWTLHHRAIVAAAASSSVVGVLGADDTVGVVAVGADVADVLAAVADVMLLFPAVSPNSATRKSQLLEEKARELLDCHDQLEVAREAEEEYESRLDQEEAKGRRRVHALEVRSPPPPPRQTRRSSDKRAVFRTIQSGVVRSQPQQVFEDISTEYRLRSMIRTIASARCRGSCRSPAVVASESDGRKTRGTCPYFTVDGSIESFFRATETTGFGVLKKKLPC